MNRIIVSLLLMGALPAWVNASRTPTSLPLEGRHYTVQSGDSLSGIAHRFHLPLRTLLEANKLEANALIRPGQKLLIPSPEAQGSIPKSAKKLVEKAKEPKRTTSRKAGKGEETYKVQGGDTLSTIAQEHGITTRELMEANGLKRGSLIRIGQVLKIPKAAKSVQTTTKSPVAKKGKEKAQTALYTVQSGDTLFSIARKYHTPLEDLMSLNGISPTDIIRPGQQLKIPGVSYRPPQEEKKTTLAAQKPKTRPKAQPLTYTVKHGDSLWKIAKKHKISIAELRKLNHLEKGTPLRSGMKLVVKAAPAPAPAVKKETLYYTVKHGDSLWKIAKKHKISIAELRKLNHLEKGTPLRSGMKLAVGSREVSTLHVAAKHPASKKETKVAVKKKKVKKTHLAKKSRSKGKSADRRIHNALAALNEGGQSSSKGGDYNVIRIAKRYLGRRYVWGAEGPNSFDCSGFTQYVMRKSKGVRLPRVSRKQAYYGKYVSRRNLKPGDLIFFDTSRSRRGYVNHVGIYIGNNKFIHASSARHRVVITSLDRPFYRARFKWGRRVN
jgi:LysM repeat protein